MRPLIINSFYFPHFKAALMLFEVRSLFEVLGYVMDTSTLDIVLNHTPCGISVTQTKHTHIHVSQNHTIWGGRVEKPPALIPCCLAYFLLYQTLETRRSLSVSCCIAPVTFSLYFAGLQNSSDTCDRDWYNKEQVSTMITL